MCLWYPEYTVRSRLCPWKQSRLNGNHLHIMQRKEKTMERRIQEPGTRPGFLSGAQLKAVAMATMAADHVNKALIYPFLGSNHGFLATVSNLFDILGRIAFPLFCFLLVEGYFKTKNRMHYLLRLLLFGILSEVPFDMATTASFCNENWNNVLFSLAFVLVTLWSIDALKAKMRQLPRWLWLLASVPIVLLMGVAAMYLSLDYEYHAILMGYCFYLFRGKPLVACLSGYACVYTEPWSLLGFGLTLTYNGQRGKQRKLLGYWFYPVHLLLIGTLRMYLGV